MFTMDEFLQLQGWDPARINWRRRKVIREHLISLGYVVHSVRNKKKGDHAFRYTFMKPEELASLPKEEKETTMLDNLIIPSDSGTKE